MKKEKHQTEQPKVISKYQCWKKNEWIQIEIDFTKLSVVVYKHRIQTKNIYIRENLANMNDF